MHAAQQNAQRIFSARHRDQMQMVGHQAPGQHADISITQIFTEQTHIGGVVII
jgi:hypothetical protein